MGYFESIREMKKCVIANFWIDRIFRKNKNVTFTAFKKIRKKQVQITKNDTIILNVKYSKSASIEPQESHKIANIYVVADYILK